MATRSLMNGGTKMTNGKRISSVRLAVPVILASVCIPFSAASADTKVRGYIKKDGTYVAPHYRSNPDGKHNNNWGTQGNVNPRTGAFGKEPRTWDNKAPKKPKP